MKSEVRFKKYFRDRTGKTLGLTGVGREKRCGNDSEKPLVVREYIQRF